MKLETQYNAQHIEVVTHAAHFASGNTRVVKYDDPLEALDDAAAMLEAAVGFMRNKYEQAWVIADAEEETPPADLIGAKLYERSGDTFFFTQVPRIAPPRFVELYDRIFEISAPVAMHSLRGLTWYRYNEVDVYGVQERGSGGTLG